MAPHQRDISQERLSTYSHETVIRQPPIGTVTIEEHKLKKVHNNDILINMCYILGIPLRGSDHELLTVHLSSILLNFYIFSFLKWNFK